MLTHNSSNSLQAIPAIQTTLLAKRLLESDRRYFEAGATVEKIPNATIAAMSELAHIPAGCVVHRMERDIGSDRLTQDWQQWIEDVEHRLAQLGCTTPRLYLETPDRALEKALLKRGYRAQVEVGLLDEVLTFDQLKLDLPITLHPVSSERDWQQKLKLHAAKDKGPDGHITPPADWIELERRKCEVGAMQGYLIYLNGQVCGTVGAMEVDNLLRLKNLVIHPEWRQRGIGVAAVQALRNHAIHLNKQGFGCFALVSSLGQRVYERAGLTVVTQQTEWYRCSSIA